jgi:hypothetical protein
MPTVVASPYCRFELESFLEREAALGRSDLVFPILYIDVPGLGDSAQRQNDPVLSLLQPEVILASTTPTMTALLQQTRTIPVVFATVGDPIGSGFVASFPRPGGNVTGFVTIEGSLGGKWLELLKEIAPHVNRVALLLNPATATYPGF